MLSIPKIYIAGRYFPDSTGDIRFYTEFGWEYLISGFYLRLLAETGEFIPDRDIIVTHEDRKFIYKNIANKIISHEEFSKHLSSAPELHPLTPIIISDLGVIVDLTQSFFSLNRFLNHRVLSHQEKKALGNIKPVSEINPGKPFAVMIIRVREWDARRGGDINLWMKIYNNSVENNIDIYIVGKNVDQSKFPKAKLISPEDYCFLISHPKCIGSFAPSSGMALPLLTNSKCPSAIFHFDDINHVDNGSGFGDILRFGIQAKLTDYKLIFFDANNFKKRIQWDNQKTNDVFEKILTKSMIDFETQVI